MSRVVTGRRPVRLGDVTESGRLRLDAVARYLQDVAGDDAAGLGLDRGLGWVLRRIELEVGALVGLGTQLHLTTTCTGTGPRWAERTTEVRTDDARTVVTARAVWVLVDLATGAPHPLPAPFFAAYGDEVRGRRVGARLTLPAPPPDVPESAWPLRATDFDLFHHVNNANYWLPVEAHLAGALAGRRITAAEIEFGDGIGHDERCSVAVDDVGPVVTQWFLVGDRVRAAARLRLAGGAHDHR